MLLEYVENANKSFTGVAGMAEKWGEFPTFEALHRKNDEIPGDDESKNNTLKIPQLP